MKLVFSMTLALALLASAPVLAQNKIDVMTQNQYLGADLDPIVAGEVEFNQAVIDALSEAAANDFPARAEALARLIATRLPALAGLQEVFSFQCFDIWAASIPGKGCDDPRIDGAFNDHLALTEAALEALEEKYVTEAVVKNLDITDPLVPGLPPGIPVYLYGGSAENGDVPDITVTVLDRDVILARGDIAGDVKPLNPLVVAQLCEGRVSMDGCNYEVVASAPAPQPVGEITIQRGWVAVDYTRGDTTYRFVNTHLEVQNLVDLDPPPSDPPFVPFGFVQAAQASELSGVLAVSLQFIPADHLIIVGDINSGPTDGIFRDPFFPDPDAPNWETEINLYPPYMQLANGVNLLGQTAGLPPLTDGWDLRPGAVPGYSCCQVKDLSNQQSEHDERIDVIFSLQEPSTVKKARVLGSKVSDKTPPPGLGLWPSDHGSVAAELQFD